LVARGRRIPGCATIRWDDLHCARRRRQSARAAHGPPRQAQFIRRTVNWLLMGQPSIAALETSTEHLDTRLPWIGVASLGCSLWVCSCRSIEVLSLWACSCVSNEVLNLKYTDTVIHQHRSCWVFVYWIILAYIGISLMPNGNASNV
jgi:hypothetical protein